MDFHPDRLDLAKQFGATPVNAAEADPAEQILDATGGLGADRGVEELDSLVSAVRSTGGICIVGSSAITSSCVI